MNSYNAEKAIGEEPHAVIIPSFERWKNTIADQYRCLSMESAKRLLSWADGKAQEKLNGMCLPDLKMELQWDSLDRSLSSLSSQPAWKTYVFEYAALGKDGCAYHFILFAGQLENYLPKYYMYQNDMKNGTAAYYAAGGEWINDPALQTICTISAESPKGQLLEALDTYYNCPAILLDDGLIMQYLIPNGPLFDLAEGIGNPGEIRLLSLYGPRKKELTNRVILTDGSGTAVYYENGIFYITWLYRNIQQHAKIMDYNLRGKESFNGFFREIAQTSDSGMISDLLSQMWKRQYCGNKKLALPISCRAFIDVNLTDRSISGPEFISGRKSMTEAEEAKYKHIMQLTTLN